MRCGVGAGGILWTADKNTFCPHSRKEIGVYVQAVWIGGGGGKINRMKIYILVCIPRLYINIAGARCRLYSNLTCSSKINFLFYNKAHYMAYSVYAAIKYIESLRRIIKD